MHSAVTCFNDAGSPLTNLHEPEQTLFLDMNIFYTLVSMGFLSEQLAVFCGNMCMSEAGTPILHSACVPRNGLHN